jgi:hypothetical protein
MTDVTIDIKVSQPSMTYEFRSVYVALAEMILGFYDGPVING